MSQNKTVIQGLEPAETNVGGAASGAIPNFYSRGNQGAVRGTVVPGMIPSMREAQAQTTNVAPNPVKPQQHKAIEPGKPVVGFLYSISRTPVGEYWPIQIGPNTIGQSSSSKIILAEATVSIDHAVIVARQLKNGGVIAAITDTRSTNGTMINGETIGFSAVECHNGDVITIGNNYELLLILVDASKSGLSVSQDFIPVDVDSNDEEEDDEFPQFNPGTTRHGGLDTYNNNPTGWNPSGGYTPSDGTVGLDGSVPGGNHGGTIPM